jgi:heptosyltransferase-1
MDLESVSLRYKKILIVRLSALGDIIHSAVVLEFIKREFPSIQIHWLVEKQFRELLKNNPYIDKLHSVDLKELKRKRRVSKLGETLSHLRKLSKEKYDLIIDMQGLLKSGVVSRIIGRNIHGFSWSSAKEGVASILYRKKTVSSYSENKILRNMKLVNDALGIEITERDLHSKYQHLFYGDSTFSSDGKILFVVGSSMEQKNYPKEKFLQLAKKLNRDISVIWGSEDERAIGVWLSEHAGNVELAPRMNLDQLKHYIFTSSLLIGNDTGPTHMAWAMNIPSVVLFGITPPEQMLETETNRYIKSSSKVVHEKLDKNDYSIRDIKVDSIIDEVNRILEIAIEKS